MGRTEVLRRRRIIIGIPVATLVVTFLLMMIRPSHNSTDMRAKGGGTSKPVLDLVCVGATLTSCPRDSRLAFLVDRAKAKTFFSAYAEPLGSSERIWYVENVLVPNEPTAVDGAGGIPRPVVMPRAAIVGPEHAFGAHLVRLLLTRRPISREHGVGPSEKRDEIASARFTLTVTP